jgi:ATP-binding cassette subfamily A (ABC1) protein 5
MSFSPLIQYLLINVVGEKEKGIKEGLYLMGMDSRAYWTSWILTYAVVNAAAVVLMVIS